MSIMVTVKRQIGLFQPLIPNASTKDNKLAISADVTLSNGEIRKCKL